MKRRALGIGCLLIVSLAFGAVGACSDGHPPVASGANGITNPSTSATSTASSDVAGDDGGPKPQDCPSAHPDASCGCGILIGRAAGTPAPPPMSNGIYACVGLPCGDGLCEGLSPVTDTTCVADGVITKVAVSTCNALDGGAD